MCAVVCHCIYYIPQHMLSAHQQIEPAQPAHHGQSRSILVNHKHYKPKIRARGQAHGPGAWSFAERARFKIAARVGRIAATAPRSKLSGWRWLALAGRLADDGSVALGGLLS